ncbi:MAG: hypothetical protein JSU87_01745 [Gemmatimonadota bacterium]|nr:MAG: hypothetical protein JSU87_01745 [Gemmatimonadota bacterium]
MARRSGKGELGKSRKGVAEPDEVLRAKYIDYCSARVCDLFMEIDEERVYELASALETKRGAEHGALNVKDLAILLVDQLMSDMSLPDLATWVEDYRRNPEQYDPFLLGLWKASVESHATS